MICLTVSSCKSLEKKLHIIDFCVYKPKLKIKPICYQYKYWVFKGETVGESFELDSLPDTVYFVDSNNFEFLLEDRDRAALYRENYKCKPKKEGDKK